MKKQLLFIATLIVSLLISQNLYSANDTVSTVGSTGFSPSNLTINIGDSVTFVNTGGNHNLNGMISTFPLNPQSFQNLVGGVISSGWTYNHVFTIPGIYNYQCDPHIPSMVGVINVLAPTLDGYSIVPPKCNGDDNILTLNFTQTVPSTSITVTVFKLNQFGNWTQLATSPNATLQTNSPQFLQQSGDYKLELSISSTGNIFDTIAAFTVPEPLPIVIDTILVTDPSSPSLSDGSIDISSSGGTGSLVYLWSNGAISEDISNLPDGTYDVTVTDDSLCTNTASFPLAAIPPPCSAGNIAVNNESCFNSEDGEISISNASGAYPLTFSIYIADATGIFANSSLYAPPITTSSSTFLFNNLIEGDYFVTFEDDTNCVVNNNIVIGSYSVESDGDQYDINTIINTVSDTGLLDGSIVLTVNQGGVGAPYTYIWYDSLGIVIPNSSVNTLDSLGVGSYSVKIIDNSPDSCSITLDSLIVGVRQACSPDSIIVNNICPGASEGSIKINYINDWTNYQFYKEINDSVWDPLGPADTDSIGGLFAGIYYFRLDSTSSSCPIDTITLEVLEPIIDSVYIVDAVNGNYLCSGDSSRVLVNMYNPNTSLTYYYFTGGLPSLSAASLVGDTTTKYLTSGGYSVGLYHSDGTGSPTACNGTPGYIFLQYDINEYDLSIEDVFVSDEICGVSSATLTIEMDPLISNNPLSYSINGATNSTGIFNIPHSTIYDTIYVTDSLGCEVYWNSYVAPADQIINTTITATIIKESCRENDGEINLLVEGGQGLYSFVLRKQQINGIPSIIESGVTLNPVSDSIIFNSLVAGTYFTEITDNFGCVKLDTFVVEQVVPFSLLPLTRVKETCCGYDGSIQVNIDTLGDGSNFKYTLEFDTLAITIANANNNYPYTTSNAVWPSQAYLTSFSSSQSSPFFDSLTRGYYSIYVEDEFGCVDSADYSDFIASGNSGINTHLSIDDSYVIDMSYSYTDVKCFGDTNATLKVLYPDVCYSYELFYYYDTTASAVIAVDSISFPDTSVYYNQLYAGIYGIQAMSTSGFVGCVRRTGDFEIIEPDIISYDSPLSTAAFCLNNGYAIDGGACNGTAWLPNSPIGGVYDTSTVLGDTVYQYYINRIDTTISYFQGPISSDSMFSGLCPGWYEVSVLDGNNCIIKDVFEVEDSSLYIDSLIVSAISCHDSSDATIQVFAHGGVGVYNYLWTDSNNIIMGTDSILDSLLEGMYFVTVSDITGCNIVDSVFVSSAPAELNLAGRVNDFKSEETCVGYSYNGSVGYEVEGGSGPYVFNWINAGSTRTGSYTAYAQYCNGCISASGNPFDSVYMLDSLTADIYKVTLTDANGCPSDAWLPLDSIKITALNINNPLSIDSIYGSDVLCYGASDGEIEFFMNDSAMLPLIYELDSNSSNILNNSTGIFSSLSANTYHVLITDSFGCFIDTSYTIPELDEIVVNDSVIDLSCYESDDGEVYINVAGGLFPYTFKWLGPNSFVSTNQNITDLPDGNYFVSIKDNFGCMAYDTVEVMAVTPLLLTIVQTTDASCNGYADASGSISVSGGTSPYQYSWTDSITGAIISTTDFISDVPAGTYTAFITDANGCQDTIELTFEEPLVVNLKVDDLSNNLCFGDSQGSITLSASGGTQPYVEYYINASSGFFNNSGSDYIFDSLIAGNYDLWVIDANECSSDTIIEEKIGEPGQIELTSTITSLSCFESNDGSVSINFSGGVAPYKYISNITGIDAVNVFQGSVILENLAEGGYDFEVTDYNECEDNISVTVDQPDLVDADFSIDENLILEGNTVTVTNLSTGANNFSWNFGNNSNTSDEFELSYKYRDQGHFTIELIASNIDLPEMCNDTTLLDIDVEGYDVNNVFSPNNDGVNDEYHFSDEMLVELKVTIYNRWGQQVYGFNDVNGSWNGNGFNGELMPEGVYFFIMEAIGSLGDSYIEEGTITLLR